MCDCRHSGADLGLGPAEDKHMPLWVCLNQIQAINITEVPSNLGEKAEAGPANGQLECLMDDRQTWRGRERRE